MQAVILWTLGTSWPHSRKASPVHICCASDEKAGPGPAESAVAATAKRSAALLVRWQVIDASPRLRAVLAALHWGRCTRLALPHASSVTRESPGVVAQSLPMFESKVLRRPAANYALMLRSCNGSRQHFLDCCVRATRIRDNSILTLRFCEVDGFRRRCRCGSLRLRPRARSNSAPGERASNACLRHGRTRRRLHPVTSCAVATPTLHGAGFPDPGDP